MKKKIVISIAVILLIVIASFIGVNYYEEKKQQEFEKLVSDHYEKYMKLTSDTDLVQKEGENWIKKGEIYKNTLVELEDIKSSYYKIKDTSYYISYDKLEPSKKEDVQQERNNLLFSEDVKIPKNTIIYQNKEKRFKLDKELQLSILERQDDHYKVLLDKDVFEVQKNDVEVIKVEERNKEILQKISIFSLEDEKNIEEKLEFLKEKEYIYLTEGELIKFLQGNILLPKNSVMLIAKEKTNNLDKLIDKYQLIVNYEKELSYSYKYGDSQVSSLKSLTKYKVTSSTSLNRFKDMLEGKKEESIYATSIAVLNYHFFYNPDGGEVCNESICLSTKRFEEQLKYLKDNNYKTLTMQEFNDWMDGKIKLPKKSVLLTIDDGAMGTNNHLPNLLEKYDANATLFLISGWWPMSKYRVGNLEIQSHGHDLHHNNFCKNNKCGTKGLMLSKEELLADLRLSKTTIGDPIAFCYPFYAYNSTMVNAVKEEFQLAFAGGNKKATRQSNKYKIPRYVIYKTTSLASFKNMIK